MVDNEGYVDQCIPYEEEKTQCSSVKVTGRVVSLCACVCVCARACVCDVVLFMPECDGKTDGQRLALSKAHQSPPTINVSPVIIGLSTWHLMQTAANSCSGKTNTTFRASSAYYLRDEKSMKKDIWLYGPIHASFQVYEDIYSYGEGVYTCPATGSSQGRFFPPVFFHDGFLLLLCSSVHKTN